MDDTPEYTIKALPDRTLEIRVAWGWDAHREQFTPATDFDTENYPTPPVAYYHGFDASGKKSPRPVYIGRTVARENRADGHYLTAKLNDRPEAEKVWQAAMQGAAAASPGTASHLIRKEADGTLTYWPIVEISAWDNLDGARKQAHPYSVARPVLKSLGLDIDDAQNEPEAPGDGAADDAHQGNDIKEQRHMTPEEVQAAIDAALAQRESAAKAEAARQVEIENAKAEAIKAAKAEWEAEAAKGRRLPDFSGQAPHVAQFADTARFDGLDAADLAYAIGVINSKAGQRASEAAYKAFAIKAAEDKGAVGADVQRAMKAAGINPADFLSATKANELNYSTQAGYGDEWVGIAYSNQLWAAVRAPASLVSLIPEIIIPQGSESIYDPLEGADPTWYVVAQTTGLNATTGRPDATVPSGKAGTDRVLHTATKVGARVVWSGEFDEDSLIPAAAELRRKLDMSAMETMEQLVIDGDTETDATTNINDIGGTPAASDIFMAFNGFRKLALVTNTANSRSASGTLADTDYLATAKLMGTAGLYGADKQRTLMVVDPNTYWKSLELASVKTSDVFSNATLEGGELARVWGYRVYASWFMHKSSSALLANTSGKVDQDTTANNTRGAILAVRPDLWKLARKRRTTFETSRYPEADANQIVVMLRAGLKPRDTECAAISYNVGV